MLADFYIPKLSNDMKVAVQKNNLGSQIWYRSLVPAKKTASFDKLVKKIDKNKFENGQNVGKLFFFINSGNRIGARLCV